MKWGGGPQFYGMIANIDYNLGVRCAQLEKSDLAGNTILIFMTDNGTANGAKFNSLESEAIAGYNAGMRGKKSSIYEGGHRVPFLIHWPAGGVDGRRQNGGSKGVIFEIGLPAGQTELLTWLFDETGKAGGACFTKVEMLKTGR